MKIRRTGPFSAIFIVALTLAGGCGRSASPVQVDAAVDQTEEALTGVLIGAKQRDYTSMAPPDKPLLTTGNHDRVYIAADEAGFVQVSRGTFTLDSVKEIAERVVKSVNRNIAKKGFSAVGTSYPPPATLVTEPTALIATLTPVLQETGSPKDRAQGKSKSLVLIRLIVTDAVSGKILIERDYYSGNDARQVKRDDPNP